MNRRWAITIEKVINDNGDTETTMVKLWAPTAQEATKHLVDLTTNNGRVVFFQVLEIDWEKFWRKVDQDTEDVTKG